MSSIHSEKKSNTKVFALVDCNNFYVSCERVFNPALEGKPVIVLSNNDGCIVSRSNEAKALGIPMAAPAFECKELIEEHGIFVFSSNYALYGDMSRRVMDILTQFSPEIETYSIDEAFLSLDGFTRRDLTNYGKEIRKTVIKWTGLPVSVGIGPTKTLAKIAARIGKKNPQYNGVFNITNHPQLNELLAGIDVSDIWGVGRQYAKMLYKNNIRTALQFKNADNNWVRKHMTVEGLRTVWELRGIPCIQLEHAPSPKKGIVCSRSFGKPVEALSEIREAIAAYMSHAAEKLRRQKSVTSCIQVFLNTNRFREEEPQYHNSSTYRLPVPSADTAELIHHATRLLEQIYKPGFRYKKAGVMLMEILPESHIQLDMFAREYQDSRKQELMEILDRINDRWGRDTIHSAATGTDKPWKMKQEKKSPRFTTRWDELPIVKSE